MKITTVLVLGAAAAAAYMVITRQGEHDSQGSTEQASNGAPQDVRSAPSRLAETVKRTLSGQRQKQANKPAGAAQAVRDDTSAANDLALAQQLKTTLSLNPHFSEDRVLVNADAGRVTLRGTTDTGEHIMTFEQTARTVPGVTDVVNLLHIQGSAAPTSHQGGLAKDAVDGVITAPEA